MLQKTNTHMVSWFQEPSIGVWEDDTYIVYGFLDQNTIRLDIERRDKRDGIGWDELQRIKDECGFEHFDAIEFYPRKKDVIKNANVRHLYVCQHLQTLIKRVDP
jgi:hypothetical protein